MKQSTPFRCQGGCRRSFPIGELFLVCNDAGALIACRICINVALTSAVAPAPVLEIAQ